MTAAGFTGWLRLGARQRAPGPKTDAGRIFQTVTRLIDLRRRLPAFANGQTQFLNTRNDHVLGYVRGGQMLILANFIEEEQTVRLGWIPQNAVDLVTGDPVEHHKPIELGTISICLARANRSVQNQ